MNGLLNYLTGYKRYFCPSARADTCLGALITRRISFFGLKKTEEGIYFSVPNTQKKRAAEITRVCELDCAAGLINTIISHKNRCGLLVGAVFCAVCVCISSLYVWDVDVITHGELTEEEVIELLEHAGFGIGSYIPSVNAELIEIKVLMNTDVLSYVAVSIKGTVATVETEQRVVRDIPDTSRAPSNLVAAEDGVIVRHEVYAGDLACEIGQVVRAGELLISGMDVTAHHGTRPTRACGAVYAQVVRHLEIFFPRTVEEKVYTGNSTQLRSISVFGRSTGGSTDERYKEYDESTVREKVTVFGSVELPVYMTTRYLREYRYEVRELTEQQSREQAQLIYYEKLAEATRDCELLSKEVVQSAGEDGYYINCTLTLLADITREIPMTVSSENN